MKSWNHDIANVKNGEVIEEIISTQGGEVPSRSGWRFPMPVEQYISHMGEDGYRFCGSYPDGDSTAIVMVRPDAAKPINITISQDEANA